MFQVFSVGGHALTDAEQMSSICGLSQPLHMILFVPRNQHLQLKSFDCLQLFAGRFPVFIHMDKQILGLDFNRCGVVCHWLHSWLEAE